MDERTKELIAVGASVAAHCQPCLRLHVHQAAALGIGKDEIAEAVAVGKRVQKGGLAAMRGLPTICSSRCRNPDRQRGHQGLPGKRGLRFLSRRCAAPPAFAGRTWTPAWWPLPAR
jgi:AhpD family alkylhydroperoxidase